MSRVNIQEVGSYLMNKGEVKNIACIPRTHMSALKHRHTFSILLNVSVVKVFTKVLSFSTFNFHTLRRDKHLEKSLIASYGCQRQLQF